MIKKMLLKLIDGKNLSLEESTNVMNEIMTGKVNPSLLSGILVALKSKGEIAEEIAGFALAMRENSIKLNNTDDNVIDVCGTGGDSSGTFNISTAAAFVVAGAGVKVAKHGNRSISSNCGSADVLTELGVNINLPVEQSAKALEEIGITFLFAPKFHPAMKHAAHVRRELGMKTIFNLLGPLTNPAGVKKQIIGAYSDNTVKLLSQAAHYLEFDKVCFLCAGNKYDEIILDQKTKMIEYNNDGLTETEISAATFGYPEVSVSEIQGGDVKDNAQIILEIFKNKNRNGAFHTVCANAAVALYSAGVSDDLKKCKNAAEESILTGAAYNKLKSLIEIGNAAE
ncbi:MAG: anthranilate phosphoribosyltransferase [Bacteroidetes bacterium]|nr:anthranilate phosphoribosyltransferase [Bacteroidota bacterium]